MKKFFVSVGVIALLASTIVFSSPKTRAATTIYVSPGSNIQAAVTSAQDGDTIHFAAGVYDEANSIVPTKNNLTLEGSGAATTTINTNNDVFYFDSAVQNLTIKGFTLTSIAGLTGVHCDRNGQGETATGTISDNIITNNNQASNFLGIYLNGGCSFEIANNTITQSTDFGILIEEITATNNIRDNQITDNSVGIFLVAESANSNNILIHNNTISGNSDGGIFALGSTASIYSNDIHGNTGGGLSGAVSVMQSTVQIYANKIYQNSAPYGGGISLLAPNEGSNVYNNYISQNSATDGPGGGILSVQNNTPIFNNTIVNNTATVGGPGAGATSIKTLNNKSGKDADSVQTANATIEKINDELKSLSDQIHTDVGEHVGGGVYFASMGEFSPPFYNNIVWGNTDGVVYNGGATPIITYNDMQDEPYVAPLNEEGLSVSGNIFTDPKLDGYVLREDSPCVDTGTSTGAPATDIDGKSRPQRNGIDIGAYELSAVTPTETAAATSSSETLPETGAPANNQSLALVLMFILLSAPVLVIAKRHFTKR